jgi:hypothetical protein
LVATSSEGSQNHGDQGLKEPDRKGSKTKRSANDWIPSRGIEEPDIPR